MPHPSSSGHAPLLVGIGEVLWDLLPGGRQLGGAPANVAWHAAQLGMRSTVVSAVGDDEAGRELLVRLDAMGIDRSHVAVDFDHPTGSARVVLDDRGDSSFIIAEGAAWDHIALHPGLLHLSVEADAVCVGTLAQRSPASRRTIQAFLGATRPGCLRVYDVNLRQAFYHPVTIGRTIACCHVVKLNADEWPVVARMLDLPADPRAGAMALRRRHRLHAVAVTCGGAGSILCDARRLHERHGAPCRVVDTVGVGDAFTAALASGLVRAMPLELIHAHAAQVASYVCSQAGATPMLPGILAGPLRLAGAAS